MFMSCTKRSSVIDSTYFGQELFSYKKYLFPGISEKNLNVLAVIKNNNKILYKTLK